MRIVDRKTFLEMPAGTIFQKYDPIYLFGELTIKERSYPSNSESGGDFLAQPVPSGWFEGLDSSNELFDIYDRMQAGEEFKIDMDFAGRDGLFEPTQLFAIYDADDAHILVERLKTALADGYSPPKSTDIDPIELLKDLEWSGLRDSMEGESACPCCDAAEDRRTVSRNPIVWEIHGKHEPDCKLAKAIGK